MLSRKRNKIKSKSVRKKTKALANRKNMLKIFTVPEGETSTLSKIEKQISKNLAGFLKAHIVAKEMRPDELEKDFADTVIPEDPMFVSDQAKFLLEKVVAQSVHTSSPSFVGHMTSALPYFMMPLSKIMTALNQNLVKIETSKAFTPLERQVLAMLHRLVFQKSDGFYKAHTHSYDEALGVMCSGGTIANITALWVARNRLFKPRDKFLGVSQEGMFRALKYYGYEDVCILLSERAHYSFRKAADVLGIGRRQVWSIPCDEHGKMDIEKLEEKITFAKRSKTAVLSLIGVAGTTETGHVDDLDALANIAEREKIFFHVDGAWGGATLFSNTHRSILKGVERADSFCIDAHKQLYVPVGGGMILFKDPMDVQYIATHAQYVIRQGSRDLGKHSLEGTRSGIALLVHSGLKIMGRKGYELLIDDGIAKAKAFAELIANQDDFELITAPELNLLTYRYMPPYLKKCLSDDHVKKDPKQFQKYQEELNNLTENIQKMQRASGRTFVSRTTLNIKKYAPIPTKVFRVVLANPLTTMEILESVLNEQRNIAAKLQEKSAKILKNLSKLD